MVRMPTLAVLCAGCLFLAGVAVAGDTGKQDHYYKWRDAHGTVHITSEPPPGRAAIELKVPAVPASDMAGAPTREPASAQSARPGPGPETIREQQAYRHRSCTAARNEIMRLDREAAGNAPTTSDASASLAVKQRNEARLRARQRMLQYCGK